MSLPYKGSELQEESYLAWIFVNKTLEEKGEDWLCAALVDGSIGYYTPASARIIVQEFKRGETESYSERCIALYRCNLLKEMIHDIRSFERRENYDKEGAQRLIRTVNGARCPESGSEVGIDSQSHSWKDLISKLLRKKR